MHPPALIPIARIVVGLLCLAVLSAGHASGVPAAPHLNFDPPRIIVSETPVRLMLIDGPPVLIPIDGTGLDFVVNTDWTVFHYRDSRKFYLLDQGGWLHNSLLASGSWLVADDLPADFLTLQVSSDWPEVAAAMPPEPSAATPLPITISYEPTVLVLIDGPAVLEGIAGSRLSYVTNTESDLFALDGRFYLTLGGRWFTTRNMNRKWYAVRILPDEFAAIPANHPRAHVLAAVPGTERAEAAGREATQARMRVVEPGNDGLPEVPWFGEPRFVPIQGTALGRGENTPFQVIRHNNFYYLCHEGAWYASSNAQGPWRAAREVPEAIYSIPPSDPAYNVTFVKVDSFDDTSGRVAYSSTGGYYGHYWTGATVVYGTGWYHPGYYDRWAYWRYPHAYGYWGPYGAYGWPYGYSHSETYSLKSRDTDWEWSLDGSKRRVYRYGPRNVVGGTYVMPESNIYRGDGRQRPEGQ